MGWLVECERLAEKPRAFVDLSQQARRWSELLEEEVRLPANPFGARPELFESPVLDLPNPFFGNPQQVADLAEAMGAVASEAEAEIENFPLARAEVFHEEAERFLSLVIFLHGKGLGIGHGLGEFEVTVVVEDGVEADRGSGGSLQVGQVFEARAGPTGEFLGAWQVLAAVGEGFAFLLEQPEFLQVVGAEAHEVRLAGDGNLESLANPPGRVGRKSSAVADIEAIDRLHQAADSFLEEVAVSE